MRVREQCGQQCADRGNRQRDGGNPGKCARLVSDPRDQSREAGNSGQGIGEAHVQTVASEHCAEDKHCMSRDCGRAEPAGNRGGMLSRRANAGR